MAKEKVTKVIDGDTFLTSRRKKPVRLANINAPEITFLIWSRIAKRKNQHVVPTKNGWGVKGKGNSKLTVETDTKVKSQIVSVFV